MDRNGHPHDYDAPQTGGAGSLSDIEKRNAYFQKGSSNLWTNAKVPYIFGARARSKIVFISLNFMRNYHT